MYYLCQTLTNMYAKRAKPKKMHKLKRESSVKNGLGLQKFQALGKGYV